MKIVVINSKHFNNLEIGEFVSETSKMYQITRIPTLRFVNTLYGRQVRKEKVIYCGELTHEVADLITVWNKTRGEESEALDEIYIQYRKTYDNLIKKIKESK